MRNRIGTAPGGNYQHVDNVNGWDIYEERVEGYINIKIASRERTLGRANFWINYSQSLGKILFRRDFMFLKKYNQELISEVCKMYGTTIDDTMENFDEEYSK